VSTPVDEAFAESAVASGCDSVVAVGVASPPPPPQAVSSSPQASVAALARRCSGKLQARARVDCGFMFGFLWAVGGPNCPTRDPSLKPDRRTATDVR